MMFSLSHNSSIQDFPGRFFQIGNDYENLRLKTFFFSLTVIVIVFSCLASGVVVCVSECMSVRGRGVLWGGEVSNVISSTFKERKLWRKTSLPVKCAKKNLHNLKAFRLAGLFVWVNEMRGQACHNPNAQRGNKFPKADLHNSIRNGPKRFCNQNNSVRLTSGSNWKKKKNPQTQKQIQRKTKETQSVLYTSVVFVRGASFWLNDMDLAWKWKTISTTEYRLPLIFMFLQKVHRCLFILILFQEVSTACPCQKWQSGWQACC